MNEITRIQRPNEEDVAKARLPAAYNEARSAIARCERLDELMDWADKAAALAAYCRIANDEETAHKLRRIQSRAYQRAGELLKAIDARGEHWESKKDGSVRSTSRQQAARDAGLTERQAKTAVRIANVPSEQFEAMVESSDPPSPSELASIGKVARPSPSAAPPPPPGFNESIHFRGALRRYVEKCREVPATLLVQGLDEPGLAEVLSLLREAEEYRAAFISLTED